MVLGIVEACVIIVEVKNHYYNSVIYLSPIDRDTHTSTDNLPCYVTLHVQCTLCIPPKQLSGIKDILEPSGMSLQVLVS